jgi:hypothetical protein
MKISGFVVFDAAGSTSAPDRKSSSCPILRSKTSLLAMSKLSLPVTPESCTDYRDKREEYQSKQVTAFPGEEISAIKHTLYDLFTKFTFLFTILILQTERYQSNFGESN